MTDYGILLDEINKESERWAASLNYQTGAEKKDIFESYMCSTIIYEFERIKQRAIQRIAAARQEAFKGVVGVDLSNSTEELLNATPTILNYNSETYPDAHYNNED